MGSCSPWKLFRIATSSSTIEMHSQFGFLVCCGLNGCFSNILTIISGLIDLLLRLTLSHKTLAIIRVFWLQQNTRFKCIKWILSARQLLSVFQSKQSQEEDDELQSQQFPLKFSSGFFNIGFDENIKILSHQSCHEDKIECFQRKKTKQWYSTLSASTTKYSVSPLCISWLHSSHELGCLVKKWVVSMIS